MKLYLFNHQNPNNSFYATPYSISVYLAGKRLSNYSILVCDKYGKPLEIIYGESLPCDVIELQKEITRVRNKHQ